MHRAQIQARVALDKDARPERYCPVPRCLWRTGGGCCPRHGGRVDRVAAYRKSRRENEEV